MKIERVCVYCGSSPGNRPEYMAAARGLGQLLAERGIGLVYGGAGIGLMGGVADGALEAGGEVIGIIPHALARKEVAHRKLSQLKVVDSMHQRKALMEELSDGFIALPGGFGTLEELLEILTWSQLGLHRKPCGILDVADYYRGLTDFIDRAVTEGFIWDRHRALLLVEQEAGRLLDRFGQWEPPRVRKWIDPDKA